MKLAKSVRLSKKTILIIGVVLGVLILVGLGWWLFTARATSDYRAQLSSSVAGIKKEITEQSVSFQAIVKEGDSAKSGDVLQKLEETLQKKTNELPATPSVWGMNISPQQDIQRREDLTKALQILTGDLRQSRELLIYGHGVAAALQEVTTKTGANAEQQKALAEAWQTTIGKLKAITPPPVAESVNQQIVQAAAKAQASLATLSDLFIKKDIPGFAAKQKEAEGAIAELRTLGPVITALHETADKNIQSHYAVVSQLLH